MINVESVIGVVPLSIAGDVSVAAHETRLARLFSPESSTVPYSYIFVDSPPRELFQPSGLISDFPSYPG